MLKSVFKEIFIMLLLCVAIVLILGVMFYNYIPTNKTIPNKLAEYSTPENVRTEIDQKPSEEEKQEISYEIDGSDLKLYRQTNSYTTGKANPFAASNTVENEENTSNNEVIDTNTNVDPKSTGTFYNDTGTK